MKAFVIGVLGITSLVGCSDGHSPAATSCGALADCCANGLPGGAGLSCSQLAGSTDQASCASALTSLHGAGYCKEVASGPPATGGDSCPRYLSCLLSVHPEAYAAAIQLYGEDSACWSNAAQSAGCEQACEASYGKIESQCTCVGSSCTACVLPDSGSYQAKGNSGSTCGNSITIEWAELSVTGARMGTLDLQYSSPQGYGEVMLEGTLQCSAASMLSGTQIDQFGCKVDVTATLTQPVVGDFLTLSGTWKLSCPSYPTQTCSQTFTLSR